MGEKKIRVTGRVFLILSFLILTVSATIFVKVDISEEIDGNIAYLKFKERLNNSPQQILLDWENQGSVACKVRFRAEFYLHPQKKPLYTAWSEEKPLEPGDHAPFELLFYPQKAGNYSGKILIYSCNLIQEGPAVNFTVFIPEKKDVNMTNVSLLKSQERKIPYSLKGVENGKTWVKFKIKAQENISDLVAIPQKYPLGWIFESGKVKEIKEGKEGTITIGYSPAIWKEKKIDFTLVTLEGKYPSVVSVLLKEKEKKKFSQEQILGGFLILVILVLILLIFKKKLKVKKDKENATRKM